jgi:anti-sigma regulatory factor (Ser/Thr protein kinase)
MEVSNQSVTQVFVEVSDPTHPGAARRAAMRSAELIGMGKTDCGNVAIAVTEMATNLLKHATRGKVIVDPLGHNGTRGLRVLALDKGPGIRDITVALRDGHSTAGTAGDGLGAIRRLASNFEIYSQPGKGTCVLAEFWPASKAPKRAFGIDVGVVSVPIRGESVCGDGWASKATTKSLLLMLADGLGHGIYASEAAREAERILHESASTSPAVILGDTHDALRKTRGAAVAIAAIELEVGRLLFSGVGNVSATLLDRRNSRGLASHNGTAGHEIRKVQEFAFPWNGDNLIVMHSDGVSGRWDLSDYPGIWNKPASVIAALLYRDFVRERDDATVLVAKSVCDAES